MEVGLRDRDGVRCDELVLARGDHQPADGPDRLGCDLPKLDGHRRQLLPVDPARPVPPAMPGPAVAPGREHVDPVRRPTRSPPGRRRARRRATPRDASSCRPSSGSTARRRGTRRTPASRRPPRRSRPAARPAFRRATRRHPTRRPRTADGPARRQPRARTGRSGRAPHETAATPSISERGRSARRWRLARPAMTPPRPTGP